MSTPHTPIEVQIYLPNGAIDTMVFATGTDCEAVEVKIRNTFNLSGGTLELSSITCLNGQVLESSGPYVFCRGVPAGQICTAFHFLLLLIFAFCLYVTNEGRKRKFDDALAPHLPPQEEIESARNFIDMLLGAVEVDLPQKSRLDKTQKHNRPESWRTIAEFAIQNGNLATMNAFPEV